MKTRMKQPLHACVLNICRFPTLACLDTFLPRGGNGLSRVLYYVQSYNRVHTDQTLKLKPESLGTI